MPRHHPTTPPSSAAPQGDPARWPGLRPAGRVVVAMSGGVDSSVTAARLLEQGYDVVGVTLHLWDADGARRVGRCCTPEDREDARRVCERLGIPHFLIDQREAFRRHVVDPFIDAYVAGRTPSPCVHCNRSVKLGPFAELLDRLGATHVATGHYARIARDPGGRPRLMRAASRDRDQSYFMYGVPPTVLDRLLLPLGELQKDDVRAEARRLGLRNADKPDSQELCFVPDGDIRDFVHEQGRPSRPGLIKDEQGQVLGRHDGIVRFTVGQRRGLGIGGADRPRYVLRIVPDTGDVVVGPHERLHGRTLRAEQACWLVPTPQAPFEATVRIRNGHEPAPAHIWPCEGGFEVEFAEPQRAITPGQAAVMYNGEEVLGGGLIA